MGKNDCSAHEKTPQRLRKALRSLGLPGQEFPTELPAETR